MRGREEGRKERRGSTCRVIETDRKNQASQAHVPQQSSGCTDGGWSFLEGK